MDPIQTLQAPIQESNIPFLSLKKTQIALDCSKQHIQNLVKRGILKPKYIGCKTYFILQDIVDSLSNKKEA